MIIMIRWNKNPIPLCWIIHTEVVSFLYVSKTRHNHGIVLRQLLWFIMTTVSCSCVARSSAWFTFSSSSPRTPSSPPYRSIYKIFSILLSYLRRWCFSCIFFLYPSLSLSSGMYVGAYSFLQLFLIWSPFQSSHIQRVSPVYNMTFLVEK